LDDVHTYLLSRNLRDQQFFAPSAAIGVLTVSAKCDSSAPVRGAIGIAGRDCRQGEIGLRAQGEKVQVLGINQLRPFAASLIVLKDEFRVRHARKV
jgi:hypothetical protein